MKIVICFALLILEVCNGYPEKRPIITVEEVSSEEGAEQKLDFPWSCGTDAFSLLISEGTIEKDCPSLKNQVNNCCVAHDNCYDDQRGRDFCDDVFCECLQTATVSNQLCHDDDAHVFCHLVRELGEAAYNASGRINGTNTEKDDAVVDLLETATTLNQTSNEYYDYYEKTEKKVVHVERDRQRRALIINEVLADPVISNLVKTL